MRVGIMDILSLPAATCLESAYKAVITRQYAGITPQAIAAWCRQMGHRVFYGTYYGQGDPKARLPNDLDVVFISTHTEASPLAYALAKLYRREKTLTVIGGPHAKAFPTDCLRFFDLVVRECDRALIADILRGTFDPGTVVSSAAPFAEIPTVAERLPEIRTAALLWERRGYFTSSVPVLSSMGCPYTCDFCTDWDTPYRLMPLDQLRADLHYIGQHFPRMLVQFHDPNFGIRFDEVLDVLETLPQGTRNRYLIEASLSVLQGRRLRRLRETGCVFAAPGVESWTDYSGKSVAGHLSPTEKMARLAERFREIQAHVPNLQANLLFGLDTDQGDEPVEVTKKFMSRTPGVWPVVNIPIPFAGTPLYDRLMAEGRILAEMPFAFYYSPYLVFRPKHYHPLAYYEKMVDLFSHFTSGEMLRERLRHASSASVRLVHVLRTLVKRRKLGRFRRLLELLRTDGRLRAFHEGRTSVLPEYYQREYEAMLGPFASLLPRHERTPCLEPPGQGKP